MPLPVIVPLALLCGPLVCGFAPQSARPVVDPATRQELFALSDAWIKAEVDHDRPALERILDPDFLATFSSGRTVDRLGFISFILEAPVSPFRVVHDVVKVSGDTALVLDENATGDTKFTWIAVRREGQWRVLSETFTFVKFAAPKPTPR